LQRAPFKITFGAVFLKGDRSQFKNGFTESNIVCVKHFVTCVMLMTDALSIEPLLDREALILIFVNDDHWNFVIYL